MSVFACVADRIERKGIEALEPWTSAGWSVHVVSSPWPLACLRLHTHCRACPSYFEAVGVALDTVAPCAAAGHKLLAAAQPALGLGIEVAFPPLSLVVVETRSSQ